MGSAALAARRQRRPAFSPQLDLYPHALAPRIDLLDCLAHLTPPQVLSTFKSVHGSRDTSFVAHSTYWLIRDDKDVVGVSNIRHSLTPALSREGGNIGYGIHPRERRRGLGVAILRYSLRRAADLGLTRVLLTCGKPNVASARTIVRNGGILESEEYLADRDEIVQRYWIEIEASEASH